MQTTSSLAQWPDVLDQLYADFPELDRAALPNTVTSLEELTEILSRTHDLTLAEAHETLLDWQFINAPTQALRHAA